MNKACFLEKNIFFQNFFSRCLHGTVAKIVGWLGFMAYQPF